VFKSNLTFCVVCVFNLEFEKSVFLRRVGHSLFNANFDPLFKKNTIFFKGLKTTGTNSLCSGLIYFLFLIRGDCFTASYSVFFLFAINYVISCRDRGIWRVGGFTAYAVERHFHVERNSGSLHAKWRDPLASGVKISIGSRGERPRTRFSHNRKSRMKRRRIQLAGYKNAPSVKAE
jgi:hypothetical protein